MKWLLKHYPVATIIAGIGVPIILALMIFNNVGWLFAGMPLLIAVGTAAGIQGDSAINDDNYDQLSNVVDLLRGYPDDWKIDKGKASTNSQGVTTSRNIRYSLHETTRIVDQHRYWFKNGNRYSEDVLLLRVCDPNDHDAFVDYKPNSGMAKKIREAIADMQKYREMKRFVNVALEAEEKKSPVDSARQALADFQEKKGMADGRE